MFRCTLLPCRCVGDLVKASAACSGSGSEVATIEDSGQKTVFRFVPLNGDDSFRIVLKDAKGGCNRFLSAVGNCADRAVYLAKEDYREGLQRWILTKAYATPTVESAMATGPSTATVTFQPTSEAVQCTVRLAPSSVQQTVSPVTYPESTATFEGLEASTTYSASVSCTMKDGYETPESEAIEFSTASDDPEIVEAVATSPTSGAVTIKAPRDAQRCSVTLTPGGASQVLSPVSTPTDTAEFLALNPATEYSASVICTLGDGSQSPASSAKTFTTTGSKDVGPVNPPSSATYCDGFGEIIGPGRVCVCDSERGFVPNGYGGCKCDEASDLIPDGTGGCGLNGTSPVPTVAPATCCDPLTNVIDPDTKECVPAPACDPPCTDGRICSQGVCIATSDTFRITMSWTGAEFDYNDVDISVITPQTSESGYCETWFAAENECDLVYMDVDDNPDTGVVGIENIVYKSTAPATVPSGAYWININHYSAFDASTLDNVADFDISMSIKAPEGSTVTNVNSGETISAPPCPTSDGNVIFHTFVLSKTDPFQHQIPLSPDPQETWAYDSADYANDNPAQIFRIDIP